MAFQVVNGNKGSTDGDGDGFGSSETNEQRTSEAGTVGGGDGSEIVELDLGLGQGLADDGLDEDEVLATGDFRNNPTVGLMQRNLRADDVGEDVESTGEDACAALCLHDGSAGLVTGSFEGEDVHETRPCHLPCLFRNLHFGRRLALCEDQDANECVEGAIELDVLNDFVL